VRAALDCSAFDAWLSPLPADCSALHFVYPVPLADLTRPLALYAAAFRGSFRCQIAPATELSVSVGLRSRCALKLSFRTTSLLNA